MTSVEIQIEPIINHKPLIKCLSGTKRATCSLKTTEIAFRVYNRSEVSLKEVKLDDVEIQGMGCSFTFGKNYDLRVADLEPGKSKITEFIPVFLPSAGVYWTDMRLILDSTQISTYAVVPRQTDLKDRSKWSCGRTAGKPQDFCRNILPVIDLHSIRLTILTSLLAVLTAGLIFLTIWLIKN
jgi:hypothetical protein